MFDHLIELRARLLRAVLCLLLVAAALLPFSEQLYTMIATPMIERLPIGSQMIATEVASPFLVPFKLTVMLALFISMPYVLYQAWAFVAPGLYQHEQRIAMPLLLASVVLFYAGAVFTYFAVLPLLFSFFIGIAPAGVAVMTDISRYLDFVLKLFFAFGLAFEIPVVTLVLIWTGMTSVATLRRKRPYVIIGAFGIGALLTPPDIISQCLLAVPVWLLFEAGLALARFLPVKMPEDESEK
ncbi:MAG: twin-arginine translocase subunit TatC [Gammaproteobacteria bacterium]|nr:twin-arginine translocase subunit TatC [Gammaproteobacteria bacterium]